MSNERTLWLRFCRYARERAALEGNTIAFQFWDAEIAREVSRASAN